MPRSTMPRSMQKIAKLYKAVMSNETLTADSAFQTVMFEKIGSNLEKARRTFNTDKFPAAGGKAGELQKPTDETSETSETSETNETYKGKEMLVYASKLDAGNLVLHVGDRVLLRCQHGGYEEFNMLNLEGVVERSFVNIPGTIYLTVLDFSMGIHLDQLSGSNKDGRGGRLVANLTTRQCDTILIHNHKQNNDSDYDNDYESESESEY